MKFLKLSLKGNLVFAQAGGFRNKFDCVLATFSPILTFPQNEKSSFYTSLTCGDN